MQDKYMEVCISNVFGEDAAVKMAADDIWRNAKLLCLFWDKVSFGWKTMANGENGEKGNEKTV